MTLTDETLRAYIESAKNATEGPWTNAKSALVYLLPDGDAICEALHIEGEFRTHIYNAAFIAASRTIGPAAAEEVLRLREALKSMATWIEIWGNDVDCNLVPTSSSLSRAADEVKEALKGNGNADA